MKLRQSSLVLTLTTRPSSSSVAHTGRQSMTPSHISLPNCKRQSLLMCMHHQLCFTHIVHIAMTSTHSNTGKLGTLSYIGNVITQILDLIMLEPCCMGLDQEWGRTVAKEILQAWEMDGRTCCRSNTTFIHKLLPKSQHCQCAV